jgi:UDP-MurNAc hydroxylase
MKNKIRFLNHACFLLESKNSILLIDPWLQGLAFDSGWALIDQSTSNTEVIEYIKNSKKTLCIWYSHEHSDHFSVSFLKLLKEKKIQATIYYQKTIDGRVAKFMKALGFNVIESNCVEEKIDDEISITTWPYSHGDSYSLIRFASHILLNINDCVITTKVEAEEIKKNCLEIGNNIDFLFTQFGYANWIGNPEDSLERAEISNDKCKRISLLNDAFDPEIIIPFASFVSFCHEDNFYLNDMQNTPNRMLKNNLSQRFRKKLLFLKPRDEIVLDRNFEKSDYRENSQQAFNHWEKCFDNAKIQKWKSETVEFPELLQQFKNYRSKAMYQLLLAPVLLELLGYIKPTSVYLTDLKIAVSLSYLKGLTIDDSKLVASDLSQSSDVLSFGLCYEYGVDTMSVNGRFREEKTDGLWRFMRFFSPQEYMKHGLGVKYPISSAKKIIRNLLKRVNLFGTV